MPDPVTIGALVAAALSAGAVEAGKAVLGAAAQDAYNKLKALAGRLLGPSVADLEAKPESVARAGVVAEKAAEQSPDDQAALKALAETLSAALTAEGRGGALATVVNNYHAGRDIINVQGTAHFDNRGRHG